MLPVAAGSHVCICGLQQWLLPTAGAGSGFVGQVPLLSMLWQLDWWWCLVCWVTCTQLVGVIESLQFKACCDNCRHIYWEPAPPASILAPVQLLIAVDNRLAASSGTEQCMAFVAGGHCAPFEGLVVPDLPGAGVLFKEPLGCLGPLTSPGAGGL